jgi:hypothetical protein
MFVNHAQDARDRTWHAKGREPFTTTSDRCCFHSQWGLGPMVSHAGQPHARRLLKKVNGRTHDAMT